MKNFLLIALTLLSFAAVAETVTYNDLAPYTSETTDFWEPAKHVSPTVVVETKSVSKEFESSTSAVDSAAISFDTRLSTFLTAIVEGFSTLASPFKLLLR